MKIYGCCAAFIFSCLVASPGAQGIEKAAKTHTALQPIDKIGEYVGQYREQEDPDLVMAVNLNGTTLTIEGEKNAPATLTAVGPDHFAIEGGRFDVSFVRDARGKISGLRFVANSGRNPGETHFSRFNEVGAKLNHFRSYTRQEVMMPMRDGVKLHAVILRPEGSATGEKLPFLMQRTPYGVDSMTSNAVNATKPELAASGYIFVYADIRGRYKSEGQFVMNRAIVAHNTSNDVDETTDTHDTIDWLLKNVPNNDGKIGVFGVSYPGFLAMSAGIDAHPAVKAVSPQAPMTDVWMGDDFFHNGAFRETYGFDYVQQLEGQKTDARVQSKEDTFDFFLHNRNFAGAAAAAKMENLPTAKVFLTQPSYTKFWQDMAVQKHLTKVEVPTLEVGGWWDQEDMWGTQAEYAALKPHDTTHEVFLVLGPWNHGGWGGYGRTLGQVDFGQATGEEYRKTIEAPFFEKYLKDKPGFELKDTASFRTGVNEWKRYDSWPPKVGFKPASLYLNKDKALSFAPPAQSQQAVAGSYVADPENPVPYRNRPIQATYGDGSKWRTWLVEDQRFVSGRKDLANFSTPVLEKDVTVTGDVVADLFAATTGTDGDFIIKLIDVYPDDAPAPMAGYQLMIVDEIFRGRYGKSFENPEALAPNKVAEYKWSLHGADHTFLKGHKIMVEVQSSWFPLYDRNPQTFVPNIMSAPAGAYQEQTISIYGSEKYPSHLEFSVPE
ncbi:CocE/NonD family hydrolase [Granulicella sp. S190]|uniref:CocE/NonD family hydrolase n=1 Tax=Granulicella sp. S190 TaxID=1747226 RepID=UPI0020B1473A|nr:CocE/NonD family hydrolase [Granulicella sp. S190]